MITVAKNSGFCRGVKRAIRIASEKPIEKRCVIGALVHNEKVIERLKNQNLEFIKEFDSSFDEFVISAHGISKEEKEKLKGRKILDATCPVVQRLIDISSSLCENDCLILVGNSEHSEVKNVKSYAKNVFIADRDFLDESTVKKAVSFNFDKIYVVFQTTVSKNIFKEYSEFINSINDERITVFNTLCSSVENRVNESVLLSKKSDFVFVVGDRSSANCSLLFDQCKQANATRRRQTQSGKAAVFISTL